jgi:hypothetical protein
MKDDLKKIKTSLQVLCWANGVIEDLVCQKKSIERQGMILLLISIAGFISYNSCSKIVRQVLLESGMSEEKVIYFLDFEKYLGEKG